MSSSLPSKLWLEVFEQLDRGHLPKLSLTSRSFSRLTRTLRFESFFFRPYAVDHHHADIACLPSPGEIDRMTERLKFWLSDEIAPLVRFCTVITWIPYSPFGPRCTRTDSPYVLLDLFFDQLSRFSGLRRLKAHSILLKRTAMVAICQLPNLNCLEITTCIVQDIAGEGEEFRCHLSSVSSFSLVDDRTRNAVALPLWSHVLDPHHLIDLKLVCNLRLWTATLETIPIFPHLRSLDINLDLSVMDANMGLLSRFPSLQSLCIRGWGRFADNPAFYSSDAVTWPNLQGFFGPHELLPIFVPDTTITVLSVHRCSSAALIAHLRRMGTRLPGSITNAGFELDHLDLATFSTLLKFFPGLTQLSVRGMINLVAGMLEDVYVNPIATDFFTSLALPEHISVLPTTLEFLHLAWTFSYDEADYSDRLSHPEIQLFPIRDAILVQCKKLTEFELDGDTFWFNWRKRPDGTVEEKINGNQI